MIDLVFAIWFYFVAGLVLFFATIGFLVWLFNAMQTEKENDTNNENNTIPRIYRDDR